MQHTKVILRNLLLVLLFFPFMTSCQKNKEIGTPANHIGIVPMDALFDTSTQQLVIYSSSGKIVTYDLTNNKLANQANANAILGYCDIGTYNGVKELYVPRSDGWLFIYNEITLQQIDQINVGGQLFSVVYNNGILFISGANNYNNSVYAYSRATKSKISEATMGDYLHIKMLPGSNTELYGTSGYSGYYLKFAGAGNWITTNTTFSSPTASSYQLSFDIFGVYPDGSCFITKSSGVIISKALGYVSTLPHGSYSFTSFDFDMANRRIYAGNYPKDILIYSMDSYQLTDTITTQGAPQKIFYNNGAVISVSKTIIQRKPYSDSTITIVERL